MREGLLSRSTHAMSTRWGDETPVALDCVYLNASLWTAHQYVAFLKKTYGDDMQTVILSVDTSMLDLDLLTMDHEDIAFILRDDWLYERWTKGPMSRLAESQELAYLRTECYDEDVEIMIYNLERNWRRLTVQTRRHLRDLVLHLPQNSYKRLMYWRSHVPPEAIRILDAYQHLIAGDSHAQAA